METKLTIIEKNPEYILYCDHCITKNCDNCNGALFGAVISDDKEALLKMVDNQENLKRIN